MAAICIGKTKSDITESKENAKTHFSMCNIVVTKLIAGHPDVLIHLSSHLESDQVASKIFRSRRVQVHV